MITSSSRAILENKWHSVNGRELRYLLENNNVPVEDNSLSKELAELLNS